jgi:metal-responsive CopG/Arc/MetJ family transcriptional regulator
MATAKIAISLNEGTVKRLDRLVKNRIFPSRSKVIQDAVEEKLKIYFYLSVRTDFSCFTFS